VHIRVGIGACPPPARAQHVNLTTTHVNLTTTSQLASWSCVINLCRRSSSCVINLCESCSYASQLVSVNLRAAWCERAPLRRASRVTPDTIHHTPYTTSQACLPSVPARREPRLRDTVYYEAYRKMPKRLYASVPCCPTRLGRAVCVKGHGCMIEVGQPRGLGRER